MWGEWGEGEGGVGCSTNGEAWGGEMWQDFRKGLKSDRPCHLIRSLLTRFQTVLRALLSEARSSKGGIPKSRKSRMTWKGRYLVLSVWDLLKIWKLWSAKNQKPWASSITPNRTSQWGFVQQGSDPSQLDIHSISAFICNTLPSQKYEIGRKHLEMSYSLLACCIFISFASSSCFYFAIQLDIERTNVVWFLLSE
jgi:hypothetical protein